MVLSWEAHLPKSSILCLKNVSPTKILSIGTEDSVKLWEILSKDASSCDGFPPNPTASCLVTVPLGNYLGFSNFDVFNHLDCIVVALPGESHDVVSVWSFSSNIKICKLNFDEGHSVGSVMKMKWVEKKRTIGLLVAYEKGGLCLWNWSNSVVFSAVPINGSPLCLEYDQHLGQGIVGSTSEALYIFSITNLFDISLLREIDLVNEGISCCISRPDSGIYVTGGWDKRIRVFSWLNDRMLACLSDHTKSITDLQYSVSEVTIHDGAAAETQGTIFLLAASSTDGGISLWRLF